MGLSEALRVQPEQLPDRINKLLAQLKAAEKQIADLKSQTVLSDVASIVAKSYDMWGVGYIAHRADGVSGNDLRTLALEIRNRVQHTPSVVAVVGGAVEKPRGSESWARGSSADPKTWWSAWAAPPALRRGGGRACRRLRAYLMPSPLYEGNCGTLS